MKTVTYETLDQIDRHILDELARDGRISVAELSRRVNLSKTPCQARITRLEKAGSRPVAAMRDRTRVDSSARFWLRRVWRAAAMSVMAGSVARPRGSRR